MKEKVQEWLNGKTIFLFCIVVLMTFEDPLSLVWDKLKYLDELFAVLGGIYIVFQYRKAWKAVHNKYVMTIVIALSSFVMIGVLGNVIYRYQPVKYWIVDLIANVKFYFVLALGFLIYEENDTQAEKGIVLGAQLCSIILIAVFLVDRIFNVYWGEVRLGIKSAQLFFYHCTYLAGAVAFLAALLTLFYRKHQWILVLGDVIILLLTLRAKAVAAAFVYLVLWCQIIVRKKDIKLWHVLAMGVAVLVGGWKQIYYYFVHLGGWCGRSIILETSFKVMKDYFPIGTGFGTYASHTAAEFYSPVYVKYGFLEEETLIPAGPRSFFDDWFWPIIFGQTGVLGTIAYVTVIVVLGLLCWKLSRSKRNEYLTGLFIFAFLLFSSTAEPTFNNIVGIPMGFVLGILYQKNWNIFQEKEES